MINELLEMERSLASFGITTEEVLGHNTLWHPSLKTNSKGKGFLVKIGPEGVVFIEEFPNLQNLRYFFVSTQEKALTFKITPSAGEERCIKAIQRCCNCTIKLSEMIGDSPKLQALSELAKTLKGIDTKKFYDAVIAKFTAESGTVYLAMEVDKPIKFDNGVQTNSCLEEINKILRSQQPVAVEGNADFFGNPDAGYEVPFSYKSKYEMKLFSKNEANRCYEKFGLNGSESCRIGAATREMIYPLLQVFFTDAYKDRLWWRYSPKRSKQSKPDCDYLVFTSLMPQDNWLDSEDTWEKSEELPLEAWTQRVEKCMKAMSQQIQTNADAKCTLTVIQTPTNGAWLVQSSGQWSANVVLEKAKRWQAGLLNGSIKVPKGIYLPVNVRTLLANINREWSYCQGEFREDYAPRITIQDAYSFFFDVPNAIERVTRLFSKFLSPVIVELSSFSQIDKSGNYVSETKKRPFKWNFLIPMQNLILYKNGITEDNFMNQWSWILGRMFREADRIHQSYFTFRNMATPGELIGQQFLKMAMTNPQRALSLFEHRFRIYENWASHFIRERPKGGKISFSLKELISQRQALNELTQGILPTVVEPKDRILLAAGASYRPPKDSQPEAVEKIETI